MSADVSETIETECCVLVVEDECELLAELAEALSNEGYTVFEAASAKAAKQILAQDKRIAVMITDIRMPECDGITLSQSVLANRSESTALEVIFISGHAVVEETRTAMQRMEFSFLRKPFMLSDLFEATERAMVKARRRRGEALKSR